MEKQEEIHGMYKVVAYTIFNTTYTFEVEGLRGAREYAKRIITEGLWWIEDTGEEIFWPVPQIFKVVIR